MTDPVFPWHDQYYLAHARPDPLAVAARAFILCEHLHATAQEHGDGNAWFVYGLASTARALAESGEWHTLGLFLTGLETLVPAEYRAKWPLHDVACDQVSPERRNGVEPAVGIVH
jgi:hypothetical protein